LDIDDERLNQANIIIYQDTNYQRDKFKEKFHSSNIRLKKNILKNFPDDKKFNLWIYHKIISGHK